MDWYEFVLWIVIGSIMLQLGKWLQRREDRRKDQHKHMWVCAYPQCDFAVGSNQEDILRLIVDSHNAAFHGL